MSGNTFREISADDENSNSNYLSLRDELFGLIASWRNDLAPEIDEHTSLVASGVIDSLSLLNLFLWIEGKIRHSIDPMEIDVARELDCVANILQFILCAGGTHEGAMAAQTFAGAPLSSPSDYRIVKFNPEYRRLVADFQTGLWSPDPDLNLRYLTWKYEANPYANQSRIYLVFHNDDLVGMRGFYASRWEVGVPTRAFPVLVADDFLIRADHRNRGLGNEIMRAAYDDLRDTGPRFLFNLSGSKLTVLGALTTGWRSIGALKPMGRRSFSGRLFPVLRRQLSRIPYLRRYEHSPICYGKTELFPFVRLDRAPTQRNFDTGLTVEIDSRPRADAMAALIRRIGHDGRFRHLRDESYLDWRYGNPLCEYRFLYAGGSTLDGYLVLKRATDRHLPSPRVMIVDLEAVNSQIRAILLKTAVSDGAFSELAIWTATVNEQMQQQLCELEFRPIDEELASSGHPCFLARPIADDQLDEDWYLGDTRLLDQQNWDVRMVYSMAG